MCITLFKNAMKHTEFSCHLFGLLWFCTFDFHIFALCFMKLRVLNVVLIMSASSHLIVI